VEIEIATTSGTRIERVTIDLKEEQSFTFPVDSEPQLVNFDYGNTLIKELHFQKTTAELIYQLSHDEDVMGRMWALGQLSERRKDKSTPETEKELILKAVTSAVDQDKFWGMRVEAIAVVQDGGDAVKSAFIAATKDQNARVRARAVQALGTRKDPALAGMYQQLLNDESYRVIRLAAEALGQTKSESAYDSLMKLVETPSWRDNISTAGLAGLAALGDKRALDVALKHAAVGNSAQVRAASISLLATLGKNDSRVFPILSETLLKSASPYNAALFEASARALVELGDQRGLEVFEQAGQKVSLERVKSRLQQLTQQLKQKGAPVTSVSPDR
jgi:aminopeptidase N